MVVPALIGAGASIAGNLLGGLMGQSSASSARSHAEEMFEKNVQLQKEFAQTGIRWKVEDARLAGVHPLYALGAQTHSFSPIAINSPADNSMANAVSNIGQDVSRAVNQTRTGSERQTAYVTALQGLQLEKGRVDLDIAKTELASRIARLNQQSGPGLPSAQGNMISGQGNSPINTAQIIRDSFPVSNVSDQKPVPDIGYSTTTRGSYPVPSQEVKQRIEDNLPHEFMHFLRNNILPVIGVNMNPEGPAKPGFYWDYHPIYGYRQLSIKDNTRNLEGLRGIFGPKKHTYRGVQGY